MMKNHTHILTTILCLLATVLLATSAYAQEDAELISRINGLRSSLGLPGYVRNGALDAAANSHARWMVTTGEVSHTQGDGSTPRTRAAAAGYSSQYVSENIYGGGNATVDVAWSFWMNSAIHYQGITSPNYVDVGIGIATGQAGRAYVLVFGNATGSWTPYTYSPGTGNGDNGDANPLAEVVPPVFVMGIDAQGNIMHEVQPGDTLGDIALLYGYTWDDLPQIRDLNAMPNEAVFLEIGSVLLIPPYAGTYTPTPGEPTATPTTTPTPSATVPPDITFTPTGTAVILYPTREGEITAMPIPSATVTHTPAAAVIATGSAPQEVLAMLTTSTAQPPTATPTLAVTPLEVAALPTSVATRVQAGAVGRGNLWFVAAVLVQVGLIGAAAVELVRRYRRGQ